MRHIAALALLLALLSAATLPAQAGQNAGATAKLYWLISTSVASSVRMATTRFLWRDRISAISVR